MELRGHRLCQECETEWRYYDTGSVACPSCSSLRSVGLDEPTKHTTGPAELDLTEAVAGLDSRPTEAVAEMVVDEVRQYIRTIGFIDAGELQPLSDTYLTAMELRRVASTMGRTLQPTDEQERYFLALLRGAIDGDRPKPGAVPPDFYAERGLAIAAAVDVYLSDVRRVVDPADETAQVVSQIDNYRKRMQALDGDVTPPEGERLVRSSRDLYRSVREDEDGALATASARFDGK